MLSWVIINVMLLLITTVATAGSPVASLLSAKSLKCVFRYATIAVWSKPDPFRELTEPEISTSQEQLEFIFDAINLNQGQARVIANQGATDVTVATSPSGINFIEVAPGGLNLTTVFFLQKKDTEEFIAVTSRHLDFLIAGLILSQLHGTCRIWDLHGSRTTLTPDHIREAQQRLNALGYAPGPTDGILGQKTRQALRLFQTATGLSITGELDTVTKQALGLQ